MSPGQSSAITIRTRMSESMGGPHHFLIRVPSNDPDEPEVELHFRALFAE